MILNSPYVSGSLTVTGNIIASGSITLSGSVASASFAASATSASYALNATTASYAVSATTASYAVSATTASFANAFTVAGNLTAQTLVVQTITSSVDYVTGSTQFGSLLTNTHVFSGSITMNPGGLFVSGSGRIGIGTTAPNSKLDIRSSGLDTDVLSIYGTTDGTKMFDFRDDSASGITAAMFRMYNSSGTETIRLFPGTVSAHHSWMLLSGNLGIGTTSPSSKLHIFSSTSGVSYRIESTATNGEPSINFYGKNSSGTVRSFAIKYDNADIVRFGTADAISMRFETSDVARLTISSAGAATFSAATSATTLTTNGTAGQWSIRVNGSSVAGSSYGLGVYAGTNSSDDAFRVHSYSGTQYLTVRGDGYVGIGTTNPGQKLEVVGGEIKAGRVDSSNEGGQVSFGRASDNNTSWYIDVYGNTSTPSLRFVDVSNSSVRMSIDGSGNTTFSNRLISNGYKSYSGEISIASGATSTIYTMSDNGLYTAQVIVGGGSLIYSAAAIFYSHSNNGQFVKTMDLYDGSNVTLDQSSGAIRITNNGFTTLTWNWSIIFQPF
jgi:hypothetical protein